MKQQLLEARLLQIEALARQGVATGNSATALLEILKVTGRDAN